MKTEKMPDSVRLWLQEHPVVHDVVDTYPNKSWLLSKRFWSAAATLLAGAGTLVNLSAGGSKTLTIIAGSCAVLAGVIRTLLGKQDSANKVTFPRAVTPVTNFVQNKEARLWKTA
jgi:hypothetical protein